MPAKFTNINHYVPQWYQRRFIPAGQRERKYHYLDLEPERVEHANGEFHLRNELRFLGPVSCFSQEHLYTLVFGEHASDIVEKRFFGAIDANGSRAVQFFANFEISKDDAENAVHNILGYLDAQKLRTPKGLDLLNAFVRDTPHPVVLARMRSLWQVHVTIWAEAVWEVLHCDNSPTKFIITDHPVATYNKGLSPRSKACSYPCDAPIGLLGTHTLFPLGLDRLLVLTNLGYVRNPWANPTGPRENARAFAPTMFDMEQVQTGRQLTEDDVHAVNFILKKCARRFVAAGEREWLYPEQHLRGRPKWSKLGDQFFLMPDPRKLKFTTNILVRNGDGTTWGADEYGRRPRRTHDEVEHLRDREWETFHQHRDLWEARFGKLSAEELERYL